MERAFKQRKAYADEVLAIIQRIRDAGTVSNNDQSQLTETLLRNPSPHDTTLTNKITRFISELSENNAKNWDTIQRLSFALQNANVPLPMWGVDRVIRPNSSDEVSYGRFGNPLSQIVDVNPDLIRRLNWAGATHRGETVVVVDGGIQLPAHPHLNSRVARNYHSLPLPLHPPIALSHRLQVNSMITRGNSQLQVDSVSLYYRPEDLRSLQDIINGGARVVSITTGLENLRSTLYQIRERISYFKPLIEENPDTTFVFAAGNEFLRGYPADPVALAFSQEPNVSVVANATFFGTLEEASGRGSTFTRHAALGTDVLVLTEQGTTRATGTSLSAPTEAQLRAMMLIVNPALTIANTNQIIAQTIQKQTVMVSEVGSGGVIDPDKAVLVALLTGLIHSGLSFDMAAENQRLDTSTRDQLKSLVLSIEPDRSGKRANTLTLQFMQGKYGLTDDELAMLGAIVRLEANPSLVSFSAATARSYFFSRVKNMLFKARPITSTEKSKDEKTFLTLLKKLKIAHSTGSLDTVLSFFRRERIRAVINKLDLDALNWLRHHAKLTNVEAKVLAHVVMGRIPLDRALPQAKADQTVLRSLLQKLHISESILEPHLTARIETVFNNARGKVESLIEKEKKEEQVHAQNSQQGAVVYPPEKNPRLAAPSSKVPDLDAVAKGRVYRPDESSRRDPRADWPVNRPPTKSNLGDPNAIHKRRGSALQNLDPYTLKKRKNRQPRNDPNRLLGNPNHPLTPQGKDDLAAQRRIEEGIRKQSRVLPRTGQGSKNPASTQAATPASAPIALVTQAIAQLKASPQEAQRLLISHWAQALRRRESTPGANALKLLLGTEYGLKQLLTYGLGGTVMQALSGQSQVAQNYINTRVLHQIATSQPALAAPAQAMLAGLQNMRHARANALRPRQTTNPKDQQAVQALQQQFNTLKALFGKGDPQALQVAFKQVHHQLTLWIAAAQQTLKTLEPVARQLALTLLAIAQARAETLEQAMNDRPQLEKIAHGTGEAAARFGVFLLELWGIAGEVWTLGSAGNG